MITSTAGLVAVMAPVTLAADQPVIALAIEDNGVWLTTKARDPAGWFIRGGIMKRTHPAAPGHHAPLIAEEPHHTDLGARGAQPLIHPLRNVN
ncbi:MAG: hypothetical protein ACYCVY_12190 [Acidiferrobacteraceae bacterium]